MEAIEAALKRAFHSIFSGANIELSCRPERSQELRVLWAVPTVSNNPQADNSNDLLERFSFIIAQPETAISFGFVYVRMRFSSFSIRILFCSRS